MAVEFFFFPINWAFSLCNCTQYRCGPLNKSTTEMSFEAHYFLVFNNIILFIKQLLYTFTTSMVTKRDNLFSVSIKPQQISLLLRWQLWLCIIKVMSVVFKWKWRRMNHNLSTQQVVIKFMKFSVFVILLYISIFFPTSKNSKAQIKPQSHN